MRILYLLLVALIASPLLGSESYTREDLEVLVAEGNYSEYLRHALEIRPSQRDDRWRINTGKMADLMAKQILLRDKVEESDLREIETLYDWPLLREDDVFKLRRSQIGQRYFENCLATGKTCASKLIQFWKRDDANPELGFSFAEIAHKHGLPKDMIWDFLTPGLRSPVSKFHCGKDFVVQEVWDHLTKTYLALGPKGNFTHSIDTTLHPHCLPAVNTLAEKRLREPDGELDREVAFSILQAQGKTPQKTQDLYYTLYLLETPSRGESFNLAWNQLRGLGKSPQRRDQVLEEMKKLSFLPDGIALSLDQQKKKVVLKHLKSNFPEYLDLYFRSCLRYYGGKGPFPKGNPTQACEGLMRSDLAPELFEASQISEFNEAIKI